MLQGQQAMLACDVWEHAYYLDYQNERPKFINSFLKKLVNWKFAAERFELRGEGDALKARDYQSAQHALQNRVLPKAGRVKRPTRWTATKARSSNKRAVAAASAQVGDK